MVITSTANEKIKHLRSLYKDRKNRYLYNEYVAEGTTISKDLPEESISEVYIKESKSDLAKYFPTEKTYFVKDEIFDAVADTKTPSGVIAVLKMPEEREVKGETVLLLCGLSDAGNVGTIMRTACARGVDTVICVDTADPYSPKSVRASMGGVLKINIVQCTYYKALALLDGYDILGLDMGGNCIYSYKKHGKIAIAVGNEAHGLPSEIKDKANRILSIPMEVNSVESLNAAVSASVAMYILQQ